MRCSEQEAFAIWAYMTHPRPGYSQWVLMGAIMSALQEDDIYWEWQPPNCFLPEDFRYSISSEERGRTDIFATLYRIMCHNLSYVAYSNERLWHIQKLAYTTAFQFAPTCRGKISSQLRLLLSSIVCFAAGCFANEFETNSSCIESTCAFFFGVTYLEIAVAQSILAQFRSDYLLST